MTVVLSECAVGTYADPIITFVPSLLGRSWRRLSHRFGKNRWQWKIWWSKSSGMFLMLVDFYKHSTAVIQTASLILIWLPHICWSDKCLICVPLQKWDKFCIVFQVSNSVFSYLCRWKEILWQTWNFFEEL